VRAAQRVSSATMPCCQSVTRRDERSEYVEPRVPMKPLAWLIRTISGGKDGGDISNGTSSDGTTPARRDAPMRV